MPKCFREYYSHQNPYFLITVGTDVYLKRATLYLYNSGEVKMYSKTILPQKRLFSIYEHSTRTLGSRKLLL